MSFDEQWAQLKAESEHKQSVHMQLNRIPPEDGGGPTPGELAVDQDKLGAIGHMAFQLHGHLKKDGGHAREASTAAAKELTTDCWATGSALTEIVSTWDTQLDTLVSACAHVSNHLDYSVAAHKKDDEEIAVAMKNTAGKPMSMSKISEYLN